MVIDEVVEEIPETQKKKHRSEVLFWPAQGTIFWLEESKNGKL